MDVWKYNIASRRHTVVNQWMDFSFGFQGQEGTLVRPRFIRSEKQCVRVRFTYVSLERSNVLLYHISFTPALTILNHVLGDLLLERLEMPWL